MKDTHKRFASLLLAVIMIVGMMIPMASAANNPKPPLGNAKWTDIGGTIKCYTFSPSGAKTYTTMDLSTKAGWVDGTDEITVITISTNSNGTWYAKIEYPITNGTKQAFIPLSDLYGKASNATAVQAGVEKRAGVLIPTVSPNNSSEINIYSRPGTRYPGNGCIDAGDDVYILGTTNYNNVNYTQIMYPTTSMNNSNPGSNSCKWKIVWIKTAVARKSLVSRQKNSSWSTTPYGYKDTAATQPTTIGPAGCGLLSIVNAVYYLNGQMIAPEVLADYALTHYDEQHRLFRNHGVGTRTGLVKAFCNTDGSKYGIKFYANYERKSTTEDTLNQVKNLLKSGNYTAVLEVAGHYVALVDYSENTGKYLVYDSAANEIYKSDGTTIKWWTNKYGMKWLAPSEFTGNMTIAGGICIQVLQRR